MREGKRFVGASPGWDIVTSRSSLESHGPRQSVGHSAPVASPPSSRGDEKGAHVRKGAGPYRAVLRCLCAEQRWV